MLSQIERPSIVDSNIYQKAQRGSSFSADLRVFLRDKSGKEFIAPYQSKIGIVLNANPRRYAMFTYKSLSCFESCSFPAENFEMLRQGLASAADLLAAAFRDKEGNPVRKDGRPVINHGFETGYKIPSPLGGQAIKIQPALDEAGHAAVAFYVNKTEAMTVLTFGEFKQIKGTLGNLDAFTAFKTMELEGLLYAG